MLNRFRFLNKIRTVHFSQIASAQSLLSQPSVFIGRIKNVREMSKKLIFIDLYNPTTQQTQQIMCNASKFNENTNFNSLLQSYLTSGTILRAFGSLITTSSGLEALQANSIEFLSHPAKFPVPWHTPLNDENRARNRHLDLLINPQSFQTFQKRSQLIQQIRQYLNNLGFLEVETPILGTCYGGANADPFITKDELFLRISPELNLKRLIVGGMDKVYEMGKQFRNESNDSTHNAEFTSLELYQAYASANDLYRFTEKFMEDLCLAVNHGTTAAGIEFCGPYPRINVTERIKHIFGVEKLADLNIAKVQQFLQFKGVALERENDMNHAVEKIIEKEIEDQLDARPTFLTNHPALMSPLAKPTDTDCEQAERFELFVGGMELVNAYSELIDAEQQRKNFMQMQKSLIHSSRQQVESEMMERDSISSLTNDQVTYCQALECGMPPTAGWGIGIDRLAMFLAAPKEAKRPLSIKDVILFPFLNNKQPA